MEDMAETVFLSHERTRHLLQIKRPVDIGLSHDWPRGIARHGDVHSLFRAKSFLRAEVNA